MPRTVLTPLVIREQAAPATPPSGYVTFYVGVDGHPHSIDDAGVNSDLTTTGAGSDPAEGAYAPGSFTLETGKYSIMGQFLSLTTTQVATLEGTAVLQIQGR